MKQLDMEKYIRLAVEMQQRLHTCPELAFHENRTRKEIQDFLKRETKLETVSRGLWLYAKHTGNSRGKRLAFRADFDAVCGGSGAPGHYCGHDGHTAILCAFAKYISDVQPEDTVYLIFQPAEETGQGAALCCELLKEAQIERIYGFHNIPGQPLGAMLLRDGTFACASTGLEIRLVGKPSHAAYPEDGCNPAAAIASLILGVERMAAKPHRGMLLGTVIGAELGGEAYGVSAGEGILRLTIRGEYQDEFESFLGDIRAFAEQLAREQGLRAAFREIERFPATQNHAPAVVDLRRAAERAGLPIVQLAEPFRWSEDFGLYLKQTEGAFFGVGDGENHPQLHTENYRFPKEIIPAALAAFRVLLEQV